MPPQPYVGVALGPRPNPGPKGRPAGRAGNGAIGPAAATTAAVAATAAATGGGGDSEVRRVEEEETLPAEALAGPGTELVGGEGENRVAVFFGWGGGSLSSNMSVDSRRSGLAGGCRRGPRDSPEAEHEVGHVVQRLGG